MIPTYKFKYIYSCIVIDINVSTVITLPICMS